MTEHYAIVDAEGDPIYVGPARGFPSKMQALLFLIFLVPAGHAADWTIAPYDPDALPLPPLPTGPVS